MDLERFVNKKMVRNIFRYYATKGEKRVAELFGTEKEHSIKSFFGSLPLNMALRITMKKINLNKSMREQFFSKNFNKQTLMNVITTIAENGLKQPFRFASPAMVVWNYTNVCNLHCRYCYQSAGKPLEDELTYMEKLYLIDDMVESHVTYLAFSGGEPLLGPDFWNVLRHASRYMHTSIATNGTLLENKELVEKLAGCGAKNVFVSLDGATEKSHDYIRGKGSFQKTIHGIENLVANKQLHVGINNVVTKRNYHEVEQVIRLAQQLGVNSYSHYNFIPTGRGKNSYEMDLTPQEREDLLNLLYDWHVRRKETGLNIISTSPAYARVIYERSGGKSAGLFHYTADQAGSFQGVINYAGGCGAGRVYAAIQPNGIVSPCVFMPTVVIGNLRESRFIDIWKSSEVCKNLSDRKQYHGTCIEYLYVCGGCRARALAYGDILGPDPGCMLFQQKDSEPELKEVPVLKKIAV